MTTLQHLAEAGRRGSTRHAPVGEKVVYVSTESSVPIYVQIAQQLTYFIYSRQLDPGFTLPSVRTLSAALGVTSNTISQAYSQLQSTGLVSAEKGRGTFVNADGFEQDEDWQVRNELAHEAVGELRRRFRALGLEDLDLRQHVEGALHAPEPAALVAFVAFTHASARKYAAAIEDSLADIGVLAETITFAEMESEETEPALLDSLYYLVTFVSTRSMVEVVNDRRDRRHRVIGISLELSAETGERLRALDPASSIALVTTERYVDIALNVIRSNSTMEREQITTVVLEGDGEGPVPAGSAVESADFVVYTFGVSGAVEDLGLPPQRSLLIDFRIDEASKANLRRILTPTSGRPRSSARTAAAPGGANSYPGPPAESPSET